MQIVPHDHDAFLSMRTSVLLATALFAIGARASLAEVDPKIHSLCLEAKDYLGCVKAMEKSNNLGSNVTGRVEECWGDWCLAKSGRDVLGKLKKVN